MAVGGRGDAPLHQAVVIADDYAGFIEPLTVDTAPMLMTVANVPLIEYVLTQLAVCGFTSIYIVASQHPDRLSEYIYGMVGLRQRHPDVTLRLISAPSLTCTSQALQHLANSRYKLEGDFLLVDGPVLTNLNVQKVVDYHRVACQHFDDLFITLVLAPAKPSSKLRSLSDPAVIVRSEATGEVLAWDDAFDSPTLSVPAYDMRKGESVGVHMDLMDTHLYVCSQGWLNYMQEAFDQETTRALVSNMLTNATVYNRQVCSFVMSEVEHALPVDTLRAYHAVNQAVLSRYLYPFSPDRNLLFVDGDPTDYSLDSVASQLVYVSAAACPIQHGKGLLRQLGAMSQRGKAPLTQETVVAGPTIVGPGACIDPAASVLRSTVGAGVRVQAGAVVRDSILLEGCVVGQNAMVDKAIVGRGAKVSRGAVVAAGTTVKSGAVVLRTPGTPLSGLCLGRIETELSMLPMSTGTSFHNPGAFSPLRGTRSPSFTPSQSEDRHSRFREDSDPGSHSVSPSPSFGDPNDTESDSDYDAAQGPEVLQARKEAQDQLDKFGVIHGLAGKTSCAVNPRYESLTLPSGIPVFPGFIYKPSEEGTALLEPQVSSNAGGFSLDRNEFKATLLEWTAKICESSKGMPDALQLSHLDSDVTNMRTTYNMTVLESAGVLLMGVLSHVLVQGGHHTMGRDLQKRAQLVGAACASCIPCWLPALTPRESKVGDAKAEEEDTRSEWVCEMLCAFQEWAEGVVADEAINPFYVPGITLANTVFGQILCIMLQQLYNCNLISDKAGIQEFSEMLSSSDAEGDQLFGVAVQGFLDAVLADSDDGEYSYETDEDESEEEESD
ncbi:hypothetical protein KIPB_000700 [Kipferlia bialata]|uniref:Mannose-1-phosphate guanyltransferase C-terminal domain-containing protein n=1 Tax=Kipferlia bialata TaxID=797122 RepID=A0A9K3CMR4_9EUKA|nr:hypothetical protein KIPB_000700 [Kipferlia bialata]|eukprot:g700.t1